MNISIIGLGKIGYYYDHKINGNIQTLSKAFIKSKIFNLECAIDRKNKNIKDFRSKYSKIQTSTNLKILKRFKSDILIVSTNTETHEKVIKDVLKIYIPKIIICEKPISYSLKATQEIINLCFKKKIKLFINYQRISNPIYIKIKSLIKKDRNKYDIEVNYSKGIYNNASHFINLILFLFGDFKKINTLEKKKIKKDYLVNFNLKKKNININFKYSNKNSICIKSKNFYFCDEKYKRKCTYKKIKIFNAKEFNYFFTKNYQYYLVKNLEKFTTSNNRENLCDAKSAYHSEKLIYNILDHEIQKI